MNRDETAPRGGTEWRDEDWFNDDDLEYCRTYIHHLSCQGEYHKSTFYELNIIIHGDARHTINEKAYDATIGHVYFIPPGVSHGYEAHDADIFHALIRCEFFEKYERELRAMPGFLLLFEVTPYLLSKAKTSLPIALNREDFLAITPVIGLLLKDEHSDYEGRQPLKNAMLLYLIGMLSYFASMLNLQSDNAPQNPNELLIARIMEYMRTNCGQKITVDQLAKRANMARSTFLRNFSAVAGCTPKQFLEKCRMAHARRLLSYTDHSITMVAMECGFYDTSHFIHTFSKYEGLSPNSFRALHDHNMRYPLCTIC